MLLDGLDSQRDGLLIGGIDPSREVGQLNSFSTQARDIRRSQQPIIHPQRHFVASRQWMD
jgi:hypothetical protein